VEAPIHQDQTPAIPSLERFRRAIEDPPQGGDVRAAVAFCGQGGAVRLQQATHLERLQDLL
jgi:hypothetical protein